MNYNVDFEICSLVFLALLIVVSVGKQQLESFQSKAFRVYLAVTLLNNALDVITCYTIAYADIIPLWVNYLLNTVFLIIQGLIPLIFVVYMFDKVYQVERVRKKFTIITFLPAIFCVLLMLGNLWNHKMFYFDAGGYHHGVWHSYLYINAVLYSVGTILYSIIKHKAIGKRQSALICCIVLIAIMPTVIQFFIPHVMLSGLGTALSVMLMYMTNENMMIYVDATTLALNREGFRFSIGTMLRKNKRGHVVVLALDNFKIINEMYGMEGGNKLLRMLVSNLKREYQEDYVYRFGGDTFAVILGEGAECTKEVDRIHRIVKQEYQLYDNAVVISACICLVHLEGQSYDSLVGAIDYGILRAKGIGKGQVFEVDEQVTKDMRRHAAIEQAIMGAIKEGHMEVHYQPIYDIHTGQIHSMEALARLNVPDYGYVSPEEFIRIAEKNGTILRVGMLVLEEVCRFISQYRLRNRGIEYVEVNLSVVQCMQEHIHQEIQGVLKKYHIPPSMINLEITESAAAYSEDQLIRNMARMSLCDITFSLDDYGSGYSNINYLVELPFSIVKIDKYIVWAAMKKVSSRKVLENTITMFKDINLKVVAEGIEDEEMMEMLIGMGADYLQGYYFSKPVPATTFIEYIEGGMEADA